METKKSYKGILLAFLMILGGTSLQAQESRPIASDINAWPSASNKITVSWSLPAKTNGSYITSLRVYRNTKPITDVTGLNPIATLPYGSVTYTDTVYDYREYFYAVLSYTKQGNYAPENELYYDEELDAPASTSDERPYMLILPGVNATVQGVKVERQVQDYTQVPAENTSTQQSQNRISELREQPLPFIDVLGEGNKGEHIISTQTAEQALTLTGGKTSVRASNPMEPYIFEEDYVSPSGGDEYLLFEVLRTSFIVKKYSQSISSLERFLALNRDPQVTLRAKFYLGQAYYFTGQYQNAIKYFMDTEDEFPAISRKWIEATLDSFSF